MKKQKKLAATASTQEAEDILDGFWPENDEDPEDDTLDIPECQERFMFKAWDTHRKFMSGPYHLEEGGEIEAQHGCDYIPLQCTGVKDGSGNLIYEGDICEVVDNGYSHRAEIKWSGSGFYCTSFFDCPQYRGQVDTVTVVLGNRYENPKLLRLLSKKGHHAPKRT